MDSRQPLRPIDPNAPLSLRLRLGLEIHRRMEHIRVEEHPLRQLFWECTQRCNLHCRHCGSDCVRSSLHPDMPLADFLPVLDEVARRQDPHRTFLIVTGGEPLLRDDLEQCGRAFYDRGFPWGMVTNGLLLTPERFRRLVDAGMLSATVSLDGLADDHNWMRGHPESFAHVEQAIRLMASEPGFVWDVVTCVNQRNYPHLGELREWLIARGVRAWRLFTVFPVGRAARHPEMQLTTEQLRGMMAFIRETRQEGRIRADYACEGFLGNYENRVRDGFYACHAGVTVASVRVDGAISGCLSIRHAYNQGNIYQDNLMDVWEQKFQKYRDRRWMRRDECARCKYFRYCEGNGMHLRDDDGRLLNCQLLRLKGVELENRE